MNTQSTNYIQYLLSTSNCMQEIYIPTYILQLFISEANYFLLRSGYRQYLNKEFTELNCMFNTFNTITPVNKNILFKIMVYFQPLPLYSINIKTENLQLVSEKGKLVYG